uniref:Serpentine receptor class gamma n=1 Tax=Panagrellus redivivus TaxID=6233 RepID=A0A7E4ZRR8_PANRE
MTIVYYSFIDPNMVVLLPYVYIIPTVIMYLILLYIFFFSKEKAKFCAAFYKIFIIQSIASIIGTIGFELSFRLPMAPVATPFIKSLPSEGFFPTVIQVILYNGFTVCLLCEALMSFNRATIVFMKMQFDQFWTKAMKYVYFLVFFLPNLITFNLWFQNVTIEPEFRDKPDLGVNWHERSYEYFGFMRTEVAYFIVFAIISVWNLIWNIYTLIYFVKRRNKAQTYTASNTNVELRMFLFSFIMFILQFATTLLSVS